MRSRTTGRPWLLSVLVVICVFVIAPVGAEAASTRAEYIATVDPLCKEGDARTRQALRGYVKALNGDRFGRSARILRRAVRVFSNSVDQVSAVEPRRPTSRSSRAGSSSSGRTSR